MYLVIIAGLSSVTDEGSIHEIVQYGPYLIPLNVFTALKELYIYILFIIKSPRTSSMVQIIFFFRSYEISRNIQSIN